MYEYTLVDAKNFFFGENFFVDRGKKSIKFPVYFKLKSIQMENGREKKYQKKVTKIIPIE